MWTLEVETRIASFFSCLNGISINYKYKDVNQIEVNGLTYFSINSQGFIMAHNNEKFNIENPLVIPYHGGFITIPTVHYTPPLIESINKTGHFQITDGYIKLSPDDFDSE